MALRTVAGIKALRAAGFRVPEARIPEGRKGIIIQEFVEGRSLKSLSGAARQRAEKAAEKLFARARIWESAASPRNWHIDYGDQNLVFDKRGNLVAWVDPIVPASKAWIRKLGASSGSSGYGVYRWSHSGWYSR